MTSYFYPTTISTWRFDVNGAYNTPLLTGSNLITNGNFETWSSATNAGTWTELLAGTSTVNREASVVQAGTYSCRFDVDAGNNVPKVASALSAIHGRWMRIDYFWNVNTGSATVSFSPSDAGLMCANDARTITPGWTADGNGLIGGTNFLLTKATLVGRTGSLAAAINNYTSSSEVGIISNADTLTPTNYLKAYYNGTQFKLDKTVAGVTTNLITVVGSFVGGASLEIVRTALATFQLRYNGAQVGTNQTVNDVAIQNGAYMGLHSNNALNKYINLIVNNQNLPFQLS